MIQKFKDKIANWFLKDIVTALENKERKLRDDKNDLEEAKKALDVQAVVFDKLKGFNSRLLDGVATFVDSQGNIDVNADIFEDIKKEGKTEDDFLAENKKLSENWALPIIVNYFIRNQIVTSFRSARSADENNFGRALVLGMELVRDEVKRLRAIFDEKNQEPEAYDKHDVT